MAKRHHTPTNGDMDALEHVTNYLEQIEAARKTLTESQVEDWIDANPKNTEHALESLAYVAKLLTHIAKTY